MALKLFVAFIDILPGLEHQGDLCIACASTVKENIAGESFSIANPLGKTGEASGYVIHMLGEFFEFFQAVWRRFFMT
jgi:hypothetical protein